MTWSYDLIADVYATDMGQSMAFDDGAYYLDLCRAHPGRVLELGCGTGRILLRLLAAGVDVIGLDRSLPMLQRLRHDAAARGLTSPSVVQGDLAALPLRGAFTAVFAPYSLVTYLTAPPALARFLRTAGERLAPEGVLAIDAFIPRDVTAFDDLRLDYRRPHGAGELERHKRIACGDDGTHTIERRYRVLDHQGQITREWITRDTIRPYGEQALREAAQTAGLRVIQADLDYRQPSARAAQFLTLVLARA